MLQEYPTQIQPRSSSTRKSQDDIQIETEASHILITLANQNTCAVKKKHKEFVDPIMLLATAASIIDNEGRYGSRLYKRKDIQLYHRSIKKRSYSTKNDHWLLKNESQSENTHKIHNSFSWQYLTMKQNPCIKRNAMHAYIAYMIYTDKTDYHRTVKRRN